RALRAAYVDFGQVVQHVVGVAGGAEHRRGRAGQPVQPVVAHRAGLAPGGGAVGDPGDVAVLVVGVGQVQPPVGHRAGPGQGAVRAAAGQLAGVLGHRVDDAVAVGELPDRP